MLTVPPPRYPRKHGRVIEPVASPTPVVPLTLVAAVYDPEFGVELTFDRAVDVAGFEGAAIVVTDGEYTFAQHVGTAATLVGPTMVRVTLVAGEPWVTPGVRLSAAAGNGIVASEGGAAWAGVSDVVVPFGA